MVAIQVLKGTSVTITETFSVDGSPIDLDSGVPTVHAFFPNGTELTPQPVASGSWTGRTTGQYRIVLDASAEVTYLDPITWVGTIGGKTQTLYSRVEWIGAFLFNLADLRAVKVAGALAFQSITDYPNQTLLDRRAQVTDDLEQRTGYSFIPRFAREVFDGDGQTSLILSKYLCQRLLSVTIDGTAQPVSDHILADTGLLQRKTGGTFSATAPQNVAVEYVYGFTRPPGEISEVGLACAAALLLPSQAGSTVNTWTTPDGTTYSYDQAGQTFGGGRRYYGIPKIDSVLSDPAYNARRGGVFA
jgi:hypothetical protein